MFQTRPYQAKAHQSIIDGLAGGVNHQLLQSATGTGKTVMFAHLPEMLKTTHPGKMLVLAHREELIDQAIEKIKAVNPHLRVDKEKALHRADPNLADVIVASVATLGRAGSKRIEGYDWSKFDKFVVDEAHHAIAANYLNVYAAAGILQEGDTRLLLGVTATPNRGDGQALAKVFQKVVFSYPMRQVIEDGWLVDVKGFKVKTTTSLDGIKSSGGEYDQTQLANTVNTPARNQQVVKAWLEKAKGLLTIGFTVDIQHAKDLAAMFQAENVKAEAIWGDDPERAWKLARFEGIDAMKAFLLKEAEDKGITDVPVIPSDGTLQSWCITVLLNAALLTEGYDNWRIGCVVLAGPTKSPVKFAQMVGRATRLEDGLGNLKEAKTKWAKEWQSYSDTLIDSNYKFPFKTDAIVLDVVDASTRNSLVTLPTLMGLNPRLDLQGGSLLGAVESLEAAQKEYPHLDLDKLENINDLEQFIESVNLFEVKFPEEVEGNSTLSWYPAPTGGYVLMLPDKERLLVKQNLLDAWEISGTIRGKKCSGERPTIEEVFAAVDSTVEKLYPEAMKLLRREETWHSGPATEPQMKLLKRLYKGKQIPTDLTKGAASKLISSAKARA